MFSKNSGDTNENKVTTPKKSSVAKKDISSSEGNKDKVTTPKKSSVAKKDISSSEGNKDKVTKPKPWFIINVDEVVEKDWMLELIYEVMGINNDFVDDYYKRKPIYGPNGFSLAHYDESRSRFDPGYVKRVNDAFGFEIIKLTNNKLEEAKEKRRLLKEQRANDPCGFKLVSVENRNWYLFNLKLDAVGVNLQESDRLNLFTIIFGESDINLHEKKKKRDVVKTKRSPPDPNFVQRINDAFGYEFIKINKKGLLVVVQRRKKKR